MRGVGVEAFRTSRPASWCSLCVGQGWRQGRELTARVGLRPAMLCWSLPSPCQPVGSCVSAHVCWLEHCGGSAALPPFLPRGEVDFCSVLPHPTLSPVCFGGHSTIHNLPFPGNTHSVWAVPQHTHTVCFPMPPTVTEWFPHLCTGVGSLPCLAPVPMNCFVYNVI